MVRDLGQNARHRADSKWGMGGNRKVMLSSFEGGQPHVAARLTSHAIAQLLERSRQLDSSEIPRQPHAAITSSRT